MFSGRLRFLKIRDFCVPQKNFLSYKQKGVVFGDQPRSDERK